MRTWIKVSGQHTQTQQKGRGVGDNTTQRKRSTANKHHRWGKEKPTQYHIAKYACAIKYDSWSSCMQAPQNLVGIRAKVVVEKQWQMKPLCVTTGLSPFKVQPCKKSKKQIWKSVPNPLSGNPALTWCRRLRFADLWTSQFVAHRILWMASRACQTKIDSHPTGWPSMSHLVHCSLE